MSGVPPSSAAYEVLKALAVGLRLQRTGATWAFVGPSQDPAHSAVPDDVMAELAANGLVEFDLDHAAITHFGHQRLRMAIAEETRIAFECLKLMKPLDGF